MDPFACIVVLTVLPVLLDTLELCAGFLGDYQHSSSSAIGSSYA
jgi:hypothetical protein